jgi:hypothetical protein
MTDSRPLPSSAAVATFAVSSVEASSTTTTSATSGSRSAEAMAAGMVRAALRAAMITQTWGTVMDIGWPFDCINCCEAPRPSGARRRIPIHPPVIHRQRIGTELSLPAV